MPITWLCLLECRKAFCFRVKWMWSDFTLGSTDLQLLPHELNWEVFSKRGRKVLSDNVPPPRPRMDSPEIASHLLADQWHLVPARSQKTGERRTDGERGERPLPGSQSPGVETLGPESRLTQGSATFMSVVASELLHVCYCFAFLFGFVLENTDLIHNTLF